MWLLVGLVHLSTAQSPPTPRFMGTPLFLSSRGIPPLGEYHHHPPTTMTTVVPLRTVFDEKVGYHGISFGVGKNCSEGAGVS